MRAILAFIGTAIRKMPMLAVLAVVAVIVYMRQPEQLEKDPSQFGDPTVATEPQPPSDLPPGTSRSLWMCVQKVDSQLSSGLWSDIYYGMEVQLDGKVVTVKVTERWRELSEDKRQTVAQLVVDTWLETGRQLQLLTARKGLAEIIIEPSGEKLEEIVIKRLPEDQTVAAWKPTTGMRLFDPQVGA